MDSKLKTRIISWSGIILSVVSIVLLLVIDSYRWPLFLLAMLGAMMYGGLPSYKRMKKIWGISLGLFLAAIAFLVFYIVMFGQQATYETFMGTFFSLLVFQTLAQGRIKHLFK